MMSPSDAVSVDAEIMHGTPCFRGTRVPVTILFDYLAHNYALGSFLEQYPTVRREQALAVLAQADELVSRQAAASKVA